MITPRQVFDAWRDNDLFGFDAPKEGETYRDYRARVGDEALAADRLFHFVLAELCSENLSAEEADLRLCRAVDDLQTVRAAIADTIGGNAMPVEGAGGGELAEDEPNDSIDEPESSHNDVECFFCGGTQPSVPAAIEAGWIPGFFVSDEEQSDPVCADCSATDTP
jgi:hypothetical protein